MRSRLLSRRALLRGIGASVALPLLDAIPSIAQGATRAPTNRLAYLYFPNGIPRGVWYPEQTANDGRLLKLNPWMSPLEPFKQDIVIPTKRT